MDYKTALLIFAGGLFIGGWFAIWIEGKIERKRLRWMEEVSLTSFKRKP